MTPTAKIYGWVEDPRFGNHVDVKLSHTQSTADVYWSPRGNSYVLAENVLTPGEPLLVSVNGLGEVRWTIDPHTLQRAVHDEHEPWFNATGDAAEALAAARHLGLLAQPGCCAQCGTKLPPECEGQRSTCYVCDWD